MTNSWQKILCEQFLVIIFYLLLLIHQKILCLRDDDALKWATPGPVQVVPVISSFYCDATNLLQAENSVKITNNWMTWWRQNDLLLCLLSTLGLKQYIGRMYFYSTTHMIFAGGSVTLGSRRGNIWSIGSKCKTKNWYIASHVCLNHLKNSNFLADFTIFSRF